jgi:NitT/TauT family transport system ATP-binding protein
MVYHGPKSAEAVLIDAQNLSVDFPSADGSTLNVLDDITLELREGEVVAILGKSGSGKSTLMRALAGLIPTSAGVVRYRGTPLKGANPGTAMVFQQFALMPWLTVQDNVELGLRAIGVPAKERREREIGRAHV